MTLEDMSLDQFMTAVSYDFLRRGYEIFWTPGMPEGEEDALSLREEWPGEGNGGFINILNRELFDDGGNHMYLSFPVSRIMRCAKRFENDRKAGFLLAVKAKGRLTNALLICTLSGRAMFQLGLFGKKFLYLAKDGTETDGKSMTDVSGTEDSAESH